MCVPGQQIFGCCIRLVVRRPDSLKALREVDKRDKHFHNIAVFVLVYKARIGVLSCIFGGKIRGNIMS